jgi:hypothetical protein
MGMRLEDAINVATDPANRFGVNTFVCGKCSGRTANAGGISWRYSGDARTECIRCGSGNRIDAGPVQPGHRDLTVLNVFRSWGLPLMASDYNAEL